eukprot:6193911-Pleurochrysis_carterae.AAC.3
MDSRVENLVRQTDGGTDNCAWDGVHYMLVAMGAFNQIDWIRLLAGHSHNEQVTFDGVARTHTLSLSAACAMAHLYKRTTCALHAMRTGSDLCNDEKSFHS